MAPTIINARSLRNRMQCFAFAILIAWIAFVSCALCSFGSRSSYGTHFRHPIQLSDNVVAWPTAWSVVPMLLTVCFWFSIQRAAEGRNVVGSRRLVLSEVLPWFLVAAYGETVQLGELLIFWFDTDGGPATALDTIVSVCTLLWCAMGLYLAVNLRVAIWDRERDMSSVCQYLSSFNKRVGFILFLQYSFFVYAVVAALMTPAITVDVTRDPLLPCSAINQSYISRSTPCDSKPLIQCVRGKHRLHDMGIVYHVRLPPLIRSMHSSASLLPL